MDGPENLCAELACGDDERAERAALRLAEIGRDALPFIRFLLANPDADVRWWAVRTLAGLKIGNEATPDLLVALEDRSSEVRQAAAMAFCQHPDPQAALALAKALSDPDPMTARLSSNALSRLGQQVTPVLLEVLNGGTRAARLEAVRALAEIKDHRAIPALMQALETDSALMQYWAGIGLDKLGVGMVYLKPE